MILIAWFVIALALFALGVTLWQPAWILLKFQRRVYCHRCHDYLEKHQRFTLEQEARENLEGRQV